MLLHACLLLIGIMFCAEISAKQVICTHPGSFGDMCIICGQRLEQESGVTFGYIHKVHS